MLTDFQNSFADRLTGKFVHSRCTSSNTLTSVFQKQVQNDKTWRQCPSVSDLTSMTTGFGGVVASNSGTGSPAVMSIFWSRRCTVPSIVSCESNIGRAECIWLVADTEPMVSTEATSLCSASYVRWHNSAHSCCWVPAMQLSTLLQRSTAGIDRQINSNCFWA